MIKFTEHKSSSYRGRTESNVMLSDVTIAFAVDFSTPGEVLTKNLAKKYGRPYLAIDLKQSFSIEKLADRIALFLNDNFVEDQTIVLNIAGNGIYTLKVFQDIWDAAIVKIFRAILNKRLLPIITKVRTGGQTGIDEAAAKAAYINGIPTEVLAPKGWKFRDVDGKDISDYEQFVNRFQ